MVSAIVLAAGQSQRMGKANKLLLPYQHTTIVEHIIKQLLDAGLKEVIVVLGHEAEKVKAAIQHLPVISIYNAGYARGLTTSIQRGVEQATGAGYLLCLSDMVMITSEEYSLISTAFNRQMQLNQRCICVPGYKGQKGNPVLFSSSYKEDILNSTQMDGCKSIVQSNTENIYWVDMGTGHVLQDMDYMEDYDRLTHTPGP